MEGGALLSIAFFIFKEFVKNNNNNNKRVDMWTKALGDSESLGLTACERCEARVCLCGKDTPCPQ